MLDSALAGSLSATVIAATADEPSESPPGWQRIAAALRIRVDDARQRFQTWPPAWRRHWDLGIAEGSGRYHRVIHHDGHLRRLARRTNADR
jgi:hypothetical protein